MATPSSQQLWISGLAGTLPTLRFLNATALHRAVFTSQIVDLDSCRVLDVIEGGLRDVLDGWLKQQGPEWCARISLATLDPAAGCS